MKVWFVVKLSEYRAPQRLIAVTALLHVAYVTLMAYLKYRVVAFLSHMKLSLKNLEVVNFAVDYF